MSPRNRSAKTLQQKRNYAFFVFVTCRNHWHGTHVVFCNLCKGHGLYSSKPWASAGWGQNGHFPPGYWY